MPSALRRTFERQHKHARFTGLSVPVWCDLAVMADIRGFADVAQHPVSSVLKQMQRLAVLLLVADRGVAAHHGHVANLALARVPKRAIGTRAVLVAVQRARLAGDEEDHWVLGGSADTALLLPAVCTMELHASVQLPRSEHRRRRS